MTHICRQQIARTRYEENYINLFAWYNTDINKS